MEKSKRSLTWRMKHENDDGVNEDSNLSHSEHPRSAPVTTQKENPRCSVSTLAQKPPLEEFFSAKVPSSSAEVRGLIIQDIRK